MARAKKEIEGDIGRIDGVFHLDRPSSTGLIQGKASPPSTVLSAEMAEMAVLDELFEHELLVLFSSNLAESGGIGQVEQAARTAVMAQFAERRSSRGQNTLALELGTRAWSESDDTNPDGGSFLSQQLEEKRRRFGMTQQECITALERALTLGLPNVIVSTRDFAALMEQQHLFTTDFFQEQIGRTATGNGSQQNGAHGRPDISTAYMAPRNEVEKLLAGLWTDAFRFQEIGVDDNFFELGGHSLLAVQLLKNINETFSARIALKDLFDGPTIAQLAARLSATPPETEDAAALESLLAEIEGMSQEQLRAELNANPQGTKIG
jgi:phthiocerol/phenolphthiocerol synthesis type-I polyketide synthase E